MMNKVEAIKIIIDSLDESERKSLMKILNGEIVKRANVCPISHKCQDIDDYSRCPDNVECPMNGKLE